MSSLKIVTRAREATDLFDRSMPRIVELTLERLEPHFASPLSVAAENLGVSLTALKWFLKLFASFPVAFSK
jgi:hypothetical protein